MKNALIAIVLGSMLTACAATGTRVSSTSDATKSLAKSQQQWCSSVGGCGCTIDGAPATCSLVASCLNTGGCQRAAQ